MKKTKLLILTALSALALAGCSGSGSADAGLPSGGKKVDMTVEANQTELKARLNKSYDAYRGELSGMGVVATEKLDANVELKATTSIVGEVNASIEAKGISAKATGKVSKSIKGNTDASLEIGDVAGDVALKASFNDLDFTTGKPTDQKVNVDSSYSLKGMSAGLYLNEEMVYVDVSGVKDQVKGAGDFLNDVIGDLGESNIGAMVKPLIPSLIESYVPQLAGFYDAEKGFDFSQIFEITGEKFSYELDEPVEWPFVAQEEEQPEEGEEGEENPVDEILDSVVVTLAGLGEYGLTVKTYGKNGYGVELDLNLESLKKFIGLYAGEDFDPSTLDQYLSKFNLTASAYVNDKSLLEKVGLSLDVAAAYEYKAEEGSLVSSASIKGNAKESLVAEFSYKNVKANMPSSVIDYRPISFSEEEE